MVAPEFLQRAREFALLASEAADVTPEEKELAFGLINAVDTYLAGPEDPKAFKPVRDALDKLTEYSATK